MDLRIVFTALVFGRVGCVNDRRIDEGALT